MKIVALTFSIILFSHFAIADDKDCRALFSKILSKNQKDAIVLAILNRKMTELLQGI